MYSICYKERTKLAILARKRRIDSDQTLSLAEDPDIHDFMKPSQIQNVLDESERDGGSTSNLNVQTVIQSLRPNMIAYPAQPLPPALYNNINNYLIWMEYFDNIRH